jgi:hypothetical protein
MKNRYHIRVSLHPHYNSITGIGVCNGEFDEHEGEVFDATRNVTFLGGGGEKKSPKVVSFHVLTDMDIMSIDMKTILYVNDGQVFFADEVSHLFEEVS